MYMYIIFLKKNTFVNNAEAASQVLSHKCPVFYTVYVAEISGETHVETGSGVVAGTRMKLTELVTMNDCTRFEPSRHRGLYAPPHCICQVSLE